MYWGEWVPNSKLFWYGNSKVEILVWLLSSFLWSHSKPSMVEAYLYPILTCYTHITYIYTITLDVFFTFWFSITTGFSLQICNWFLIFLTMLITLMYSESWFYVLKFLIVTCNCQFMILIYKLICDTQKLTLVFLYQTFNLET